MSEEDDLIENEKARRARANKLSEEVNEVLEDSEVYNGIISRLIGEYTIDLDSMSSSMDSLVKDIRKGTLVNYSDLQLEMRCIVLAQALHKATEGLGILGGQSDMSRMNRERRFAEVYKGIKGGTIPDKKAEAEEHVLSEKQVEALFQRAYQTLSSKIRSGNRVLEALKKILTSRMIAMEVFRKELDPSMASSFDMPDELKDTETDEEVD